MRTDNRTGQSTKTKALEVFARELKIPETTEQNGVAERFNRTVVKAARCLLIDSKLSKSYWVRSEDTECYARKLVVIEKNTLSVFEKNFGTKPSSDLLKVFACVAFPKHRDASKTIKV